MAEKRTFDFEHRLRRHDGVWRVCSIRAVPVFSADGAISEWVGVHTDITEQKRADEALRQSESRFQVALKNTRIMVYNTDAELRYTWIQNSHPAFRSDDVLGRRDHELFPPHEAEPLMQLKREVLASGVGKRAETAFEISGAVEVFDLTVEPLRDAEGNIEGVTVAAMNVTDRKRAERVVTDSEALFRSIADYAPVMMWVTDPSGACTYLSRRWYEFTGTSAGTDLGLGWVAHIHPEGRARAGEIFMRANARREPFNLTYRLRRHDGAYRWAEDVGEPRFDAAGHFLGFVGTVSDVHERTLAESSQQLRHERARLLSDISAQFVLRSTDHSRPELDQMLASIFGDVARHLEVSCYLNYGVDAAEANSLRLISGRGFASLAPSMDRRIIGDAFCGMVAKSRRPLIVENVQSNGLFENTEIFAVGAQAYAGYPLLADGLLIGVIAFVCTKRPAFMPDELAFIGAAADLVAAAVYREHLSTEIKNSEARFRAMADNVPNLAWMVDGKGHVDWFNQRWLEYTGTTAEENYGSGWKAVHHPDYLNIVAEKFEQHVREGRDWEDTFPLRAKDGSYRWFLSRMKVIRDESGQVLRFFGTNTDVTQERHMAEHLLQLSAALSEADRRKDEFLATLAHELRNPLAPLKNSLEIMKRFQDKPGVVEQARGTMERQVVQMVRLIDDLLDVSRITRDKLELRTELVELATVVNQALEACRPLAERAGHQLSVLLPPGPVQLRADPARLIQVLDNLLTNAIKYTPPGGQILLAVVCEASDLVIKVKDSGVGIPKQMLQSVFELFTQVDGSLERSVGGLGMGLSLVKRLVELHGGSVVAHSEGSSRGSEFVVRMPVVEG